MKFQDVNCNKLLPLKLLQHEIVPFQEMLLLSWCIK